MFTEKDWKVLKAFDRAAPNAVPGQTVEMAEKRLNEALLSGEPKPDWLKMSLSEWESMRQQAIEDEKILNEQELIAAWDDAGRTEPFDTWKSKQK